MTRTASHCLSLPAFLVAAGLASSAQAATAAPAAATLDCSDVYGHPATCNVVACSALYMHFLGVWSGPFEDYVRELSTPQNPVFRPYQNRVSYTAQDCLTNSATGETFIVGHETNDYPAFRTLPAQTTQGLIITGSRADGTPFLRTVDRDGRNDYAQLSKMPAKEGAIWQLTIPASNHPCPTVADAKKMCGAPEMQFQVSDSRDLSRNPANVRDVVVEMTVGPAAHPYWHGVISRGEHERQNTDEP